jgi:DNA-3-methyladenine glycosylase I
VRHAIHLIARRDLETEMADQPIARCAWAMSSAAMIAYHDTEWGVPCRDERTLFEFLVLEGAQAGLSWETVLRKRDAYRQAFDGFDAARVAAYTAVDVERLLADAGIIRNRAKIAAAIGNARAWLAVQQEFGSAATYLWGFTNGEPVRNAFATLAAIPAQTPTSIAMSRDLRRRGFRFCGPTICYAFMQAVGMVNDHTTDCYRYAAL